MTRIFWDVDTQVDFMEPSGKLYVPGAREIAPALERLVDAARAARLVHVASADDHELTDPEISSDPDFRNTYPPHCMRGTRGAEKIRSFEEKGVPVDAYGVGSSLIRGSNDFTGDIVLTDGMPSAKVGRHYRENPRLELVT